MGCVSALLSLMVLVIPLFGYVDVAATAIDTVESHVSDDVDTAGLAELNSHYFRAVLETPVIAPLYRSVGAPLFAQLTAVNDAAVTLIAHGIADRFTAEELQEMSTEEIVDRLIEHFNSAVLPEPTA